LLFLKSNRYDEALEELKEVEVKLMGSIYLFIGIRKDIIW
jgi:hypothetical protein